MLSIIVCPFPPNPSPCLNMASEAPVSFTPHLPPCAPPRNSPRRTPTISLLSRIPTRAALHHLSRTESIPYSACVPEQVPASLKQQTRIQTATARQTRQQRLHKPRIASSP